MTSKCLIALGANLSTPTRTPLDTLRLALRLIDGESIDLRARSSWYSTSAFPKGSGPDYTNAVAQIETQLTPIETLEKLANIETKLGRLRKNRWDARVCDLDLITHGDRILPDIATYTYWRDLPLSAQITDTPQQLILPHPRVQDRAFVLIPLRDIAPDWQHPVTGQLLEELIEALPPEALEDVARLSDTEKTQ